MRAECGRKNLVRAPCNGSRWRNRWDLELCDYVIQQLANHARGDPQPGRRQSLPSSPAGSRARMPGPSWRSLHHLYDEEREDFRRRLDHVLFHPDQTVAQAFNPRGWVVERRYNEQDFEQTVAGFLRGARPIPEMARGARLPGLADQLRGALGGRSRRVICLRPGWRTICSTRGSWSSCNGPTRPTDLSLTKSNTPDSGDTGMSIQRHL